MLLIAVGPRAAKLIEEVRAERREELRTDIVGAILEVCSRGEGIEATGSSVEGVVVAEVVVADESLILGVDGVIDASVKPLGTLHLRGDAVVGSGYAGGDQGGDRARVDCDRRGALQMLVGSKEEELVLEDRSTHPTQNIVDVNAGLDDATRVIGVAVRETGAGSSDFRTPDVLSLPVQRV